MSRYDRFPEEPEPIWATIEPPDFTQIRAGVRYTLLELDVIWPMLQKSTPTILFGAIGRLLPWARSDGPWIPFDPKAWDPNYRKVVDARPWPWCVGDEIWYGGFWEGLATAWHLTPEWSEFQCWVGKESSIPLLRCEVARWASEGSDGFARGVDFSRLLVRKG